MLADESAMGECGLATDVQAAHQPIGDEEGMRPDLPERWRQCVQATPQLVQATLLRPQA
ncbi:MAG: hypothetical protein ONB25_04995 [candidate division KSB1 bacterium]|nr:hypothetical protein [candidate division KSB1 bacterium]